LIIYYEDSNLLPSVGESFVLIDLEPGHTITGEWTSVQMIGMSSECTIPETVTTYDHTEGTVSIEITAWVSLCSFASVMQASVTVLLQ
jgi:hypothetical protein